MDDARIMRSAGGPGGDPTARGRNLHLIGLYLAVAFAMAWALWFVLGVQICFSSFFLSMLGVSRKTWIGDNW